MPVGHLEYCQAHFFLQLALAVKRAKAAVLELLSLQ
jgi:hypothetical protein